MVKAIRQYGAKAIRKCHETRKTALSALMPYGLIAFTMAEILIVLTIIGVMAVLTVPSLIQNSQSQAKITKFKKAYAAISNAYATEFALKNAPKMWNGDVYRLFDALSTSSTISTIGFSDSLHHKLNI